MKAFPETAYPGRSSKTKRSRPATWNCWQRSLGQTQRGADGEPVSLDVEEHEGAVVAPAGKIEAGYAHVLEAQVASSMARCFIHDAGFSRGRRAVASNLNKTTEQKQD